MASCSDGATWYIQGFCFGALTVAAMRFVAPSIISTEACAGQPLAISAFGSGLASASGVTSPSFAAALPGTASFARALPAHGAIAPASSPPAASCNSRRRCSPHAAMPGAARVVPDGRPPSVVPLSATEASRTSFPSFTLPLLSMRQRRDRPRPRRRNPVHAGAAPDDIAALAATENAGTRAGPSAARRPPCRHLQRELHRQHG